MWNDASMITTTTTAVETFPSVRLPSQSNGLPVEVVLIAQIGIGAGSALIAHTAALQRGHASFVDALDEPSARIGGADLARGDATSLYTFTVGAHGHPFHCHAGHRVFTAISGSAGARLRFSTASSERLERDPQAFFDALRHVEIPPDCLFTVRFGGGTWHQFVSCDPASGHPALFALSCHTDELGGDLKADQRARVLANEADIPSLTELLPPHVAAMLEAGMVAEDVPTVTLSLVASTSSLRGRFCARTRSLLGRMRAAFGRLRKPVGFFAASDARRVVELPEPPPQSLLWREFTDRFHHQDSFALEVEASALPAASASQWLAGLLDGFLENRPVGVSRLMNLRNILVRPLGLRTSPLGCPVSSLLSDCPQRFAGRFPVLGQSVDADGRRAQVLLGADDKHLQFRSCVGVEILPNGNVRFTLGTRVRNRNRFGHLYMRLIDRAHRRYAAPTMLSMAVGHVLGDQRIDQVSPDLVAHGMS